MKFEYTNTYGDVSMTYKVAAGELYALQINYTQPTSQRLKVTQLESMVKKFVAEAQRLAEPFVAASVVCKGSDIVTVFEPITIRTKNDNQ